MMSFMRPIDNLRLSKILGRDAAKELKEKAFDCTIDFTLAYVGSKGNYQPREFYEACDNQGATLTVFKTDDGSVFGYYTSQSWESTGGLQHVEGRSFFFKKIGKQVDLYESKEAIAYNYHGEDCLVTVAENSFFLSDQNNQMRNDGIMKPLVFDFP